MDEGWVGSKHGMIWHGMEGATGGGTGRRFPFLTVLFLIPSDCGIKWYGYGIWTGGIHGGSGGSG